MIDGTSEMVGLAVYYFFSRFGIIRRSSVDSDQVSQMRKRQDTHRFNNKEKTRAYRIKARSQAARQPGSQASRVYYRFKNSAHLSIALSDPYQGFLPSLKSCVNSDDTQFPPKTSDQQK
jgi:hypothetical protein